jgi:hypothetical protein
MTSIASYVIIVRQIETVDSRIISFVGWIDTR